MVFDDFDDEDEVDNNADPWNFDDIKPKNNKAGSTQDTK
jgi:hypothetical protein